MKASFSAVLYVSGAASIWWAFTSLVARSVFLYLYFAVMSTFITTNFFIFFCISSSKNNPLSTYFWSHARDNKVMHTCYLSVHWHLYQQYRSGMGMNPCRDGLWWKWYSWKLGTGGDGAVCVAMQLSNQEFLDSSVIVGVMHSPDCTSSYPRRARSAIGVDTVLTLDVCLYVC